MTKREHKHDQEAIESEASVERESGTPTDDELASAELFSAEPPAEAGPAAAPAMPEEPSEELQQARGQAAEYLDGWQRARAEFANYKKRVEREMADAHARAAASILVRFLPVLDDLERALRERPAQADPAWVEGIELVTRKLQALLESEGVDVIPAEGELFDPTLHEAVTHEDSGDHREGQIIAVIQQGYRLGERVLRPSLVRVAR